MTVQLDILFEKNHGEAPGFQPQATVEEFLQWLDTQPQDRFPTIQTLAATSWHKIRTRTQ